MEKINSRLMEISDELDKHVIAVRGALELAEESASTELQDLLSKAIERMDTIQKLSHEIFAVLQQVFEKMDEIKKAK
jgi:hypothetical protein